MALVKGVALYRVCAHARTGLAGIGLRTGIAVVAAGALRAHIIARVRLLSVSARLFHHHRAYTRAASGLVAIIFVGRTVAVVVYTVARRVVG